MQLHQYQKPSCHLILLRLQSLPYRYQTVWLRHLLQHQKVVLNLADKLPTVANINVGRVAEPLSPSSETFRVVSWKEA